MDSSCNQWPMASLQTVSDTWCQIPIMCYDMATQGYQCIIDVATLSRGLPSPSAIPSWQSCATPSKGCPRSEVILSNR